VNAKMPLVDPVTMSGMSGSSSKNQSPSKSDPIELLRTPAAQIIHHIIPFVHLSIFYVRFPALVADPVPALAWALIPLVMINVAYCVTCLPMAGSSTKATRRVQKIKGVSAKRQSDGSPPMAKVSVSLL
jgi:GPI ethanolamine phosphate transferase 2/3 subunit F